MFEVSSLSSPLELLVGHRQPPYIFATDIIEAPNLVRRLNNLELSASHKADLLTAALHSLPNEEADWKAYNVETTPNVPCNGFAVGTIFGACALDKALSEAFIEKLEAHDAANTIFASDSRLAYVALQRIRGTTVDSESLDRYTDVLEPYLPPIDIATQARDLMYSALDSTHGTSHHVKKNVISPLTESLAQATALLRLSDLNPQEQDQLNAEIAGLTEVCLTQITTKLRIGAVIERGGSCKDSNYADLARSVKALHDSIEPISFLPATILRELDAMTARKAEEYAHPRAHGEAPHDAEMLDHAHNTVNAFLGSLIERRQTEGQLDAKTLVDAQTIIRGSLKYLPLDGADSEQTYAHLLDSMRAIFSAKEIAERKLDHLFQIWRHKRYATLNRKTRLEAGRSPEDLPETIHAIHLHIPNGSVMYHDKPEEVTDDVMRYLKQPGHRKVFTETGMNSTYHVGSLDVETVERKFREWNDTHQRNNSFYIEWSAITPHGHIDPHRMVIMKEIEGKRRIIIEALDEQRPSVRQLEIEAFAKLTKGRLVDYDDMPEGSIVLRPDREILAAAEPNKKLIVPIFLNEIANAYAHILGLNVDHLAYARSPYGRARFTDGLRNVDIFTDDFDTVENDGMAICRIPVSYHEGVKRLGLRLPGLRMRAHSSRFTEDDKRKSVESTRAFSHRVGVQPVPDPWISSKSGITRHFTLPK